MSMLPLYLSEIVSSSAHKHIYGYINKSDSWQMGCLTKILKGMGVLEGSDDLFFASMF